MKNWINTKIMETREVWSLKMVLQLMVGLVAACTIIIVGGTLMQGVNPNDSIPGSDSIVRIEAVSADSELEPAVFEVPADIDWIRNNVVIYSRHKLISLTAEDTVELTVTFTLTDGSQFVMLFGNETVSINGEVKALQNAPGKSLEMLERRIFEE